MTDKKWFLLKQELQNEKWKKAENFRERLQIVRESWKVASDFKSESREDFEVF